ncbi:MAG: PEGA domain-containing protein, partial [Methanospirillum sp.]|nr:PEGA domain-containing protein [Methanospirillum sp.]
PGHEYGWVEVDSDPAGAEVTFDGVYRGPSPVRIKIHTTGTPSHQVLVRMAGYYDWNSGLSQNPAPDETISITAALVPEESYGSIRVMSSPSRSVAILDGGSQDTTPCTFHDVIPGTHTISLVHDGYQPYSTRIRVSAGGEVPVSATLISVPATGTLYVTSAPSGSDIWLDGIYEGQTPYLVSAVAGDHTLEIKHAGFETWRRDLHVNAGEQKTVDAQFSVQGPTSGSIQVASIPGGSSVYLGTDYYGRTPGTGYLDLSDIAPGTYSIRISHPQNQDYSGTVTVSPGQTTTVQVALPASPAPASDHGTVSVSSSPSGADVLLDNVFTGITPFTLVSVSPGNHTLILRIPGYEDSVRSIQISAGNTTDVMVGMTPVSSTPVQTQAPPTPEKTPVGSSVIAGVMAALLLFTLVSSRQK